jgi:protein involved in polysaccharide export with SLBB domain
MKKKYTSYLPFIYLILSPILFAQEQLNEDFLKSLPEDVRNDFIREMGEQNEVKDEIYNAPKTSIDTLESNLQKIQYQLAEIERNIQSQSNKDEINLKRFGPDFFNSFQSTFMPVNEPNFSSDYVVDAGDTLKVQLVGQRNEAFSLVVQKDGSINVPEVAAIYVAGLPLKEASDIIQATLAEAFIGIKVFTTLTNMRNISILVIGNVNNPGVYTYNGGTSVLSVLNGASGIAENGSFRSIQIKRNNEIIDTVDLYDVLINGNLKFNHGLRSGDAVIIGPKRGEVSISGGVNNPGIYELKDSKESLSTMLAFAGGLIPGNQGKIMVERKVADDKQFIDIPVSLINNFDVIYGDDIKIPSYASSSNPMHSVVISGEVLFPGKYTINDGQTLSSVIRRAGGYTANAFEFGGNLTRESAKEIEKEINERIYQDMIKFIATSANAKEIVSGGGGTLPLILSEFKNVKPVGRVTADFDLAKIGKRADLDTALQNGDRIHIPPYSQEIYVLGEVLTPGARLYEPGTKAQDYIKKSGGLGLYGDKKRIVVISPNGDSFLWSGGFAAFSKKEFDIIPGTVIYVPREIGKVDGLNYAAAIAPIFSSLALSLASLNSISD